MPVMPNKKHQVVTSKRRFRNIPVRFAGNEGIDTCDLLGSSFWDIIIKAPT